MIIPALWGAMLYNIPGLYPENKGRGGKVRFFVNQGGRR